MGTAALSRGDGPGVWASVEGGIRGGVRAGLGRGFSVWGVVSGRGSGGGGSGAGAAGPHSRGCSAPWRPRRASTAERSGMRQRGRAGCGDAGLGGGCAGTVLELCGMWGNAAALPEPCRRRGCAGYGAVLRLCGMRDAGCGEVLGLCGMQGAGLCWGCAAELELCEERC